MFRSRRGRTFEWGVLGVCAWIALATPWDAVQGQLSKDPDLSTQDDGRGPLLELDAVEMGAPEGARKLVDKVLRLRFIKAYEESIYEREVFETYLETLGAEVILDYLEATIPYCHSEAHELGAAIFAKWQDLDVALRSCGRRCTAGCMHGVVREAFRDRTIDEMKADVGRFCKSGAMSEQYKPGNCAHGLGHALMIVSGRELSESLDGCAAFPSRAMAYYCATGVYMEYFAEPEKAYREMVGLNHYPCNIDTRFPAACYRYHGRKMLRVVSRNVYKLAEVCRALHGRAQRLGCFHGLGSAMRNVIAIDPLRLGVICEQGTADDQAVCIEGAIEKLADLDQPLAFEACTALREENADVCKAAAREKMYRLNKPTLPLYTGP